jgi:hypothetical protein
VAVRTPIRNHDHHLCEVEMGSSGGAGQAGGPDAGRAPLHVVRDLALPGAVDRTGGRDAFRAAVGALDPGPLRELLTAVAYARDEVARSGSSTAPAERWSVVVAAAERAVRAAAADVARPRKVVA